MAFVNDNEEEYVSNKPKRAVRKKTRASKVDMGVLATPKATEVQKVESRLRKFIPTETQYEFIDKIENNIVTFVDSPAGTGKTSAALYYFCKQYLHDHSLDIVITRTPAEVGKDKIGFLPASATEKCALHYASTKKIIEGFIGKEKFVADFEKRIHFTIPNYILGATLDNSLWLIDEAQLMQPIIMKLLLERIGHNTKVVVSGSSSQIYTGDNGRGGMQDALNRFFDKNKMSLYPNFAYHHFSVGDVKRSEVVKDVLRAYGDV